MHASLRVNEEIEFANLELKGRRRYRLHQLYNFETRLFEEELATLGLAVRRRYLYLIELLLFERIAT